MSFDQGSRALTAAQRSPRHSATEVNSHFNVILICSIKTLYIWNLGSIFYSRNSWLKTWWKCNIHRNLTLKSIFTKTLFYSGALGLELFRHSVFGWKIRLPFQTFEIGWRLVLPTRRKSVDLYRKIVGFCKMNRFLAEFSPHEPNLAFIIKRRENKLEFRS